MSNQENQVPTLKGFLEFCKEQGNEPINHDMWETCAVGEYARSLGLAYSDLFPLLMSYTVPVETEGEMEWESLHFVIGNAEIEGNIDTYLALTSLLEQAKPKDNRNEPK